MDSKEFGLVAAQQLFKIEDIHYGFWKDGEEATLGNWKEAQEAHTQFLFDHIFKHLENKEESYMLDIGCGVGFTTQKLLKSGYKVDGLVPYQWMAEYASNLVSDYKQDNTGRIYECTFEDFKTSEKAVKYQLAFFSESFQYVNLDKSFKKLDQILTDNGKVVIFDFFKKDDVEGKSPLGGGHHLSRFYDTVKQYNYEILTDLDVTTNLSPNLKLVNEVLVDRLIPFSDTLNKFLSSRYPKVYKLLKLMFRKKLSKLAFKYSEDRNEENFIKYKSYRLIVLSKKN
jgi:SAM-dependent methyltransferase